MSEAPELESRESFELPLFPLGLVLYPGMVLPLHIFEERYIKMIGECRRDNRPFGVILIKEGKEVGGAAVPVNIGTTAKILDTLELPGGRMNILTRGQRRFEVLKITQRAPHIIAKVKGLADEEGEVSVEQLAEGRSEYAAFLAHMAEVSGGPGGHMKIPDEAVPLSFAIASRMASSIELPVSIRQEWLSAATAKLRLLRLLHTLRSVNGALEAELGKRKPVSDLKLN